MSIVEYKNLSVSFNNSGHNINAVNNVSFSLEEGKILGIVGESGCGKSVTAMSLMRLINEPQGRINNGEILFNGLDIVKLSEKDMTKIRGKEIAAIYQDPLTALNSVYTIGKQMVEAIITHKNISKIEGKTIAINMLKDVGIYRAEAIYNSYPNELSGGMRQRVLIAMALCSNPKILIADEPTTALDVTIQAQILELLKDIREKYNMSIIMITHDLGIVAELCDKVVVMYAGQVVEEADIFELFDNPLHPYTKALMNSRPNIDLEFEGIKRLPIIKGQVPSKIDELKNCYFLDRCDQCEEECRKLSIPKLKDVNKSHKVSCHLIK